MDSSNAKPKNVQVSQNRGWTSFDDSPVHSQLQSTSDFSTTQSPWKGVGDDGWTNFPAEGGKSDSNLKMNASAQASTPSSAVHPPQKTVPHSTQILSPGQQKKANHKLPFVRLAHSNNSKTPVKPANSSNYPTTHPASSVALPPSAIPHANNLTPKPDASIRLRAASKEEIDLPVSTDSSETSSEFQDPWCITVEQRQYYTKQFVTMQTDVKGKIDGQTARSFFTKSKLPILELSHVWELSDMDQDGHLTLDEFCTAFHLVVARKNGYELPNQLPQALVPTLVDIRGESNEEQLTDSPTIENRGEQWETFSERTASSTALANFDQVPDSTQKTLPHPVAQRVSPSRHHEHWATMGDGDVATSSNLKVETLDEESTTSSPHTRVKKHHHETNPYGFLRNELSDADSSDAEANLASRSSISSQSSETSKDTNAGENVFKRSMRSKGRSKSSSSIMSSTSSVASSERSSDGHHHHGDRRHSDHEHSDWASRPLRPGSSSNSSEEDITLPSLATIPAPTPPPRPHIPAPTASPLPKPRSTGSKLKPDPSNNRKDEEKKPDGPAPPPRHVHAPKPEPVPVEQESFADFSAFNQSTAVQMAKSDVQEGETPKPRKERMKSGDRKDVQEGETPKPRKERMKSGDRKEKKDVSSKPDRSVEKPVPVPRSTKEATKSSTETEINEKEREKTTATPSGKKAQAPTKPPRHSRVLSASDIVRPEPTVTTLTISKQGEAVIPPAPKQNQARRKAALQSSIKELKMRNTQLSKMNADLQQQLKDTMETRITIEMNVHQMRPFSQ